jgi:hypothetical protein
MVDAEEYMANSKHTTLKIDEDEDENEETDT